MRSVRLSIVMLALAATTLLVPLASANPFASPFNQGPDCDKHPILAGPVLVVGECGDLLRCLTQRHGHWGVYASVNGFGVIPEKPLVYCL